MNARPKNKRIIDKKYLKEIGNLTWIKNKGIRGVKGNIAGTINNGYVSVKINNCVYQAHRIAWFLQTSEQPNVNERVVYIERLKND